MICGRNISVSFGPKQILFDVSVDVPFGQVVALCGPNGAGKSTLLSALVGDLAEAKGHITYGKTNLTKLTPPQLSQKRAVLEQSPSLSARFTVDEMVRLSIPIELPPQKTDDLVQSVLQNLGLAEFQATQVSNLSGGQCHRAHLARVLAQLRANSDLFGPNFLFLDEPTASLDILHQIEVMKTARAEARKGTGVLVVLHDLNLAAAFADQIVLMQNGAIAKSGTVGDVFQSTLLSHIYGTPIIVEKSAGGPLHIHPDYERAA